MTTTQLWGFDPTTGTKYKLDTYPTEPIKLTFTAENLTDLPTVNSVYSQTFRLPATGTNNQFFLYWFNVNINDFDVSLKVSAEIITESGLFIEGQIRLQKVYRNYESTLIDYEVLFLGEVRDFATQVGDGFMNTLNLSDLQHILNYSNIVTSWNAQPGTNNGLLNGNVLYPLVEYGYDYDNNGQVLDNMIRAELATATNRAFSSSSYPLSIYQWRPWIRAKYLIDKIFSLTDYSYELGSFFETDLFDQLYINATGNQAVESMQDLQSNNLLEVGSPTFTYGTLGNQTQYIEWPTEILDSGDNWNGLDTYTAPVNGSYTFNWDLNGDVTWVNIGGGTGYPWPNVKITFFYWVNNVGQQLGVYTNGGVDPGVFFFETGSATLALNAGDTFRMSYVVENLNGTPPTLLYNTQIFANVLTVTSAPISVNPGPLLPNNVKIIDWFRSILKKFRLVMVPKRDNPKVFVIQPWSEYIATGVQYDWTHKLDGSKDITFEPLFFTQSASIKFTDIEDQDHPNNDQQTIFKEVYGTRLYESGNDLLRDQRTIDTVFAPTPVQIIDGATTGSFIFPHLAQLESTNTGAAQLKPIVAKPRILFYNGLKAVTGIPGNTWYFDNGGTPEPQTQYPMVSYMSEFPTTGSTLNLSWEIENGRWFNNNPNGLNGEDVYQRYWQSYIDGLYSSEARKMTATFVLDAQDLKVDFNDSIFIRDSWWRILKINNAPLDGVNAVRVELIKLLNAPNADCECLEYFVTDNRFSPEGVFFFNYIDCQTGETVVGEVFQNSVVVCSCEPIFTGTKDVLVTPSGGQCATVPPPIEPVEIQVEKSSSNGGAITVDQSDTGSSDWVSVFSKDYPSAPVEETLNPEFESGTFGRIGYQQTTGTGDVVTIAWLRDGAEIYSETFDASGSMQYVLCPEQINTNFDYTASVTVSSI